MTTDKSQQLANGLVFALDFLLGLLCFLGSHPSSRLGSDLTSSIQPRQSVEIFLLVMFITINFKFTCDHLGVCMCVCVCVCVCMTAAQTLWGGFAEELARPYTK